MRSGILSQQANIMSAQIMSQMKTKQEEHLDAVYASEKRILKAMAVITPTTLSDENSETLFEPEAPVEMPQRTIVLC